MEESETECAVPGLNTLEPECVTAHSRVSDEHNTAISLRKIKTDIGGVVKAEWVSTESSTGMEYVTHLHPDQIKAEIDDGDYVNIEQGRTDLQDFNLVKIGFDEVKCDSGESLVSNGASLNTAVNGDGADCEGETESWQCDGLQACYKNKGIINDLRSEQCCGLNQHYEIHEANHSSLVQGSKCLAVTYKVILKHTNCLGEKPFMCTQCGKSFGQLRILNQHQKHHSLEKTHKCVQCGRCFKTVSNLNAHQRTHSNEKPYLCTVCGKSFNRESILNVHERIHSGEKPYKCTQCGKSFNHGSTLNQHQRIHSGEKPYKCVECGKCFNKASHLNQHQIMHSGEKPHECIQCGKSFTRSSHLSEHKQIHSGEKPHKCVQCGKCFTLPSYLNKHQRTHSGERMYTCTHCGKCFKRAFYFIVHQRKHSGENP